MSMPASLLLTPYAPVSLAILASACLLLLPAASLAQASRTGAGNPNAAGPPPGAAPLNSRPSWAELTAGQQQSLRPLAGSWNGISAAQKRKWLEISKNYASLSPQGQATLHSRMNEWVALSPQQRAQARLNFGKTQELSQQLSPEEKQTKWQSYQALSPEEKQKLAAKAAPKPAGAATAVKPVAPQKLATVPAHAGKPAGKPPASQTDKPARP